MRTTPETLRSLRMARATSGGPAYVGGDVLDAIVDDLEDLSRRERAWDAQLQRLEAARDDSTPRDDAQRSPERIALIEQLEREQTEERARRNVDEPGRYAHAQASFFQTRGSTKDSEGRLRAMGIRDVVAWARTDKGGKQFPILQPPPSGGCMRWGICEAPRRDVDGGGR